MDLINKNISEASLIKNTKNDTDINKFKNFYNKQKNNNIYKKAELNATNRVYDMVLLSKEDIILNFDARKNDDGKYVSSKQYYEWVYNISEEFDSIPLDSDIATPVNSNNEPIIFKVSFYFKNKKFLHRCKEYYIKHNINFKINNIKNTNWKITLKVVSADSILF